MANKDLSEYLSTVTPDYSTTTLSISPHEVIVEEMNFTQVVHTGDDGSEERITLSDDVIAYMVYNWKGISDSDAGLITDMYADTTKAKGLENSFKLYNPIDANTYVVRFTTAFKRGRVLPGAQTITQVRFRVLGNAA